MSVLGLGRVSRNSAWLLLGQVAGIAISFAFTLFAARILGASGFGQYAFALTLTSFLTLATSLGLDVLLVRTLARDFSQASKEFTAALRVELGRLPVDQRRAFELGVLHRRPYAEISELTGWSVSKVKVNVYRARKKLITALNEHQPFTIVEGNSEGKKA